MKTVKKVIAFSLAFLMMFCMLTPAISGASVRNDDEIIAELPFALISDIHYYPPSYMGNNNPAWNDYVSMSAKEYEESEALVKTALDSIMLKAETEDYKYLLIPGDLTKDSEFEGHSQLATILEEFEKKSGIEVFVINGNHDINVQAACTFENGTKEPAKATTQTEFREIYKNLGYDHAISEYIPPEGTTQGGLSYAADLDDNYRLIALDSCKYDAENPAKQQTDGMISDDTMQWVKDMAADAIANGITPIIMTHHSIAPHIKLEPSVTYAFCIDDYMRVGESFADAGIHYAFTGHQHTNDISSLISDNGNVIYDCEVGALTGFPNQIRECNIVTYGDGESEIEYNLFDVDFAHPVTVNGYTYEKPFSESSFAINFGGKFSDDGFADAEAFFMGIIKNYLLPYVDKINQAGGINEFLKTMNIDLENLLTDLLSPYLGNGIKVCNTSILSVDNLMWFIEDLMGQVEELYINNPDNLVSLLEFIVGKLINFEVSSVPCTKFIDSYHFGDASKGGNLGEFILSAMVYWYTGNEDSSDDTFINDVLYQFENGDLAKKLLNTLIDIILNDLVYDAILSKLDIRFYKLVDNNAVYSSLLGSSIDQFTKSVLNGDTSYLNLVNTVFSLGILPYDSIEGIIESLMDEYITPSQLESIGYQFAYCIRDFVTDENPVFKGDNNVTYSTAKIPPEVTQENYRLPSMINVTIGADSTSANINWFTKYSVKGSDIEIYSEDEFVDFTGVPTEKNEFTMDISSEKVSVSYPGIDLGIFGLFYYDFELIRHTATLSGLEADKTYYYRVGDAEKGWWSDTGSITTQDNSDSFTFINVTDSQSQTQAQFERGWKNVMDKAFELYPKTKLVLHTGDMVDNPKNVNQYGWLFNTAKEQIMNTYLMPVTGNHEDFAENAITDKFTISDYPEQDTTTGVYYSFDYNNAHFMILNTNELDSDELSAKQIEWLRADANSSDAQWKIVAIHKAVYSNGSHYDDNDVVAIRKQLSTLMPELGIDIVFQGHDHVYMRTYSLDNNLVTDTERVYLNHNGKKYVTDVNPSGTSYVITGTSGVKIYNQKDASLTDELFPRAEKIVDVNAAMFSAIEIDGGILYFDAYTVDGEKSECVDSFAIQKDITQGEYAGDCENVSAEKQNNPKEENIFKKLIDFIKRIGKVLYNIYKIWFA